MKGLFFSAPRQKVFPERRKKEKMQLQHRHSQKKRRTHIWCVPCARLGSNHYIQAALALLCFTDNAFFTRPSPSNQITTH